MTRQEAFDKKQKKLERMEKIVRDAIRLKDAIKSEVDAIMEEIDAEINSPKKAKPVFWDGKQPHYWSDNGRYFRKATKCDIGKNVIVCSWGDPNPLHNLENISLLEAITQFDDFTVRSTNRSRLCHFPLAWVECHHLDATFEDVPHICVFANNILAKQADKPEQADPLIDEESFLQPEPGTVAEEKWSPRIGDWVRIKKCVSACCWVGIGMDYLDGQIRQVEKLTPVGQGIVVDGFYLCENSIAPWEPREGEKVEQIVSNRHRVYKVDGFDRITKMVFCVGRSHGIELRLLKPYIEQPAQQSDHIADAKKKVPPAGYRLLDKSAKVEPRKAGDLYWSCSIDDWVELAELAVEYANRDDWPACRKIEDPVEEPAPESQGYFDDVEGVWIEEADPYAGRKIEQAKAPEPQYREPTQADLANGPVDVEVCDATDCDTNWEKRQLYAILPQQIIFCYICQSPFMKGSVEFWKHARIKVEG